MKRMYMGIKMAFLILEVSVMAEARVIIEKNIS